MCRINLQNKITISKRVLLFTVSLLAATGCTRNHVKVSTDSMEPTILEGDLIRVQPLDGREIPRGAIVAINDLLEGASPGSVVIGRVIALGGDRISIVDRQVIVNGRRLTEDYVAPHELLPGRATGDNMTERTVPDGHFFYLGDNRDFAYDSRNTGFVPLSSIRGFIEPAGPLLQFFYR